jgi:hypothetical protein
MKKLHLIIFALVVSLWGSRALAVDEYPTTGIVYNTMEDSSITYSCAKMQNDMLECEFFQTSVRKKIKPDDVKQKIEDAKKQFPDALKELSARLGPLEPAKGSADAKKSPAIADRAALSRGDKQNIETS